MGQQVFSTAGADTFTVPGGVTSITVECWGPGNGSTGGAYAAKVLSVTPSAALDVLVGSPGNSTWFLDDTTVLAHYNGSAASSIGTTKYSGGNGGSGDYQSFGDGTAEDPFRSASAGGGGGAAASAAGDGPEGGAASYPGGGSGVSGVGPWAGDGGTGGSTDGDTDSNCGNSGGFGSGFGGGGGAAGYTTGFPSFPSCDPGPTDGTPGDGGIVVTWSADPNTYNETGSGGVVVDSTATVKATYKPSLSGGLLGDSSATIKATYAVTTAGGVVADSSATQLYPVSNANLEHYWKLDESTSELTSQGARDAVYPDVFHDLLALGSPAPTSVTGVINGAAHGALADGFGFVSSFFNLPLHIENRDFTFSLWIKSDSWSGDRTLFQITDTPGFFAGDTATNSECQLIYDSAASRFKFTICAPTAGSSLITTTVTASSFGAPSTGVWINIVVWFDRTNSQIGIACNGGGANTASHTTGVFYIPTPTAGATGPRIEFGGSSTKGFGGAFDETAWWSRLLTSAERFGVYNNGSGLALASFVTTPNNFVEYGHGGCVADGSATMSTSETKTGSGGIVADSTATNTVRSLEIGTGGFLADGTSTNTVRSSNIAAGGLVANGTSTNTERSSNIAAGGLVANGTSTNTVRSSNIAAGGLVVSGQASVDAGGLKCGGTAKVTSRYNSTATNGAVLSGHANGGIHDIVGSGGAKVAGTVDLRFSLWHGMIDIPATVTVTATANVYTLGSITISQSVSLDITGRLTARPRVLGGAVLAGSAKVTSVEARQAGGGVVVDGSAKHGQVKYLVATGGLVADGTSKNIYRFTNKGTGGVVIGTTGQVWSIQKKTVSGGVKCDGTSRNSIRTRYLASGGAKLGTAAVVSQKTFPGINITASVVLDATGRLTYRPRVSGGVKAGGASKSGLVKREAVSGGVVCGGSAKLTMRHGIKATGGAVANGTAKNSQRYKLVASGGILANSAAKITTTFVERATGGCVVNGTAKVSSAERKTSSGGVKAGTSGKVSALLHGQIDITCSVSVEATPYQFIGSALAQFLQDNLVDLKIYPLKFPEHVGKTAVCYTLVSQEHWHGLIYRNSFTPGMATARIQLDVVGKEARTLAKQIQDLIDAYTGTWGQIDIIAVNDFQNIDGDIFAQDGSDRMVRRRVLDFSVIYRESKPVFNNLRIGSTKDIEEALVAYLQDLAPIYHSGIPQAITMEFHH